MSYLLVTIGGQLGWLRLFWQLSTLYLSHICLYIFVHVLWKIVIIIIFFFCCRFTSRRYLLNKNELFMCSATGSASSTYSSDTQHQSRDITMEQTRVAVCRLPQRFTTLPGLRNITMAPGEFICCLPLWLRLKQSERQL